MNDRMMEASVGTGLHSIYNDINGGNFVQPDGKSLELECDILDNILARYKPDAMKIDIEDAEVLALKRATNTLKQLRKIIVEIHGDNFDKVKKILEAHNFKLEIISASGHMTYITGSK
jgi:hypothetical protein